MLSQGCGWTVVSKATNPSQDFELSREDVSMLQWVAYRYRTGAQASVELDNTVYGHNAQAEPSGYGEDDPRWTAREVLRIAGRSQPLCLLLSYLQ
jgi:hypothetical protein